MSQEEAVDNEGGMGEEDPECPTACGQPVKPCPKRKKRRVSYLWRPPPPSPRPSYSPCPHIYFKNLKAQRQKELSRDEHIGILATPSKHPWQKSTLPRPQLVRYRKREVTPRNIQLAVPKLDRVQALFEEQRDCGVLEISRLERLEAMLQEEFLLSPVQAKKIVTSVRRRRRKKKKLEVCEPCPFMDERIPSTEFSRENFMKGMITEIANHVSDVTEIKQGPTAKRLEEIVTAIMERIEGLVDEDTPPPDPAQSFGDGKLSQLLVNCAGRMAEWIENVVYEADKAVIENFEAADAENRPPPCDHEILPCGHLPMLPCGHQVIVPCSFHTTACYPPPPREPKPPPPSPPCDPCCQMPPPLPPCKEWVPCYENAPKCGTRKPRKCGKKKHKKKKKKSKDDDEDEDEETCRCTCECEPRGKKKKKGKKKKGKGKDEKVKKGEEDEDTLVGQQKDDEEGDGDAGETGGEETEGEGGESEVEGGGDGGDDGAGGGDEGEGGETEESTTGSKLPSSKTSPGKTPPKTPTSGGSKPTSPSKSPDKSPPPKSPSSGKSPPKSADKTPGDKSPAKSGDKSPAKSGDKSPAKSGDKTPAKSGDKSPAKSGDKSPAKSGDKSPAKSGDKSPGKSGDKSPSKSGDKSPAKSAEKSPQKSGGGTPGKTGSKPPSGSATPGKTPGEEAGDEGGEGGDGGEGDEGEAGAEGAVEGAQGDEAQGDENAEDAPDQQIEDLGDALAEEAIEGALEEETEETTTFNSILEQLAVMVEDIPDKDPDKRRIQLTKKLEDKFTELVTAEGEIDDATKQTVIKVATKIANWMEDVIEEAESRLSSLADGDMTVAVLPPCQRVPSPVTSESVRDWASWIVEAMAVADDWADWISKTVRAAEEKAAKKKGMVIKEDGGVDKLTRKEYTAFKDDVKTGAIDYRMKKKYIAEQAYDWKQKTHDRPLKHRPKPGDPTTSSEADEGPAPPPAEEEAPPPAEEEAPPPEVEAPPEE